MELSLKTISFPDDRALHLENLISEIIANHKDSRYIGELAVPTYQYAALYVIPRLERLCTTHAARFNPTLYEITFPSGARVYLKWPKEA